MAFCAVDGMLAVMLIGQFAALGALAASVALGIGAAVIVLAAHIGLLATIPASVYGFASVAGLILPTIASIIIGAAFGWVYGGQSAGSQRGTLPSGTELSIRLGKQRTDRGTPMKARASRSGGQRLDMSQTETAPADTPRRMAPLPPDL